ncbi:MAG: beta-ketoacyl synthase N-terminal-like domain-containing protein [Myxococcota bacterium]
MSERVFITGMGVLCSLARSIDELSAALQAGRSGIGRSVTRDANRDDRIEAAIGELSFPGLLAGLPGLGDPLRERARRAARRAPLHVQATVLAALQAWVDSQLERASVAGEAVSIVATSAGGMQGYHHDAFIKYQAEPDYLWPRYALHGLATDPVATISEVLAIRGEGMTVSGASASGNVAIIKAARLIEHGLAEVCLVLGTPTFLSPVAWQAFRAVGALGGKRFGEQPDRACRPFDRDHEGFIPGQGAGCVILESQASVERRGVKPTAQLIEYLGGAICLDGNRQADPSEEGEARAMQQCLVRAGLAPSDVDYINTHGTSSPLGDHTEIRALKHIFGDEARRIWLNSSKSLIGHCLFSAGVLEAIMCAVQMRGEFAHPNLNLLAPIADGVRWCGPAAQPAHIDVALSNSFGFGGLSTAILLARPTRPGRRTR